ncbi:neuropeptide Y receptor type 6 [Hydra vulgaris]|uniref:Neuropeptide Y receptor type 6 n=1 Tax=Hydra vulgaris TaxID=6087 RepID=A0ABM4C6B9_HYDVU
MLLSNGSFDQKPMDLFNNSLNNGNFTGNEIVYTKDTLLLFHTMYVLVMCFGIFGNILTCSVILLNKSMRKSIHFYTFNLAVCDLMILFVYVPTQMIYIQHQLHWTLGFAMCKLTYLVLPVSLFSTIGTLLAITIDRARGLIQPFKWRADSTRYSKFTICGVWLISLLVNTPLFITSTIRTNTDKLICAEKWPSLSSELIYWNIMFVLSFVIPLLIIIVAHIVMIYVMMKETNSAHREQNKRVIRMLVALVMIFSICTGYQHVYFYLSNFYNKFSLNTWNLMFASSNFVVSLQAALNPVIYGTLRHDFNKAFLYIILKVLVFFKLHKELPRDFLSTNSTISGTNLKDTFRRSTFIRLVKRQVKRQESMSDFQLTEEYLDASCNEKTSKLVNNNPTNNISEHFRMEATYILNNQNYTTLSKMNSVSTLCVDIDNTNNYPLNGFGLTSINIDNNKPLGCYRSKSQELLLTPEMILLRSSKVKHIDELNTYTLEEMLPNLISRYLEESKESIV